MVHDLLVIGGGIQGVAVARDAALRGLRVLLLERGDFASGTSSRSSKLIHGGIRYLETGQIRLVREALHERALLLQLAPEYVRPLPFLIPHFAGEGRSAFTVGVGLKLYAMLAGGHPLAAHRSLTAQEALSLEPSLRPERLQGASLYWDAQMDDALLCVAIAMAADRAGALMKSYTEAVSLTPSSTAWAVRWRDVDTGEEGTAQAAAVVNAAGPWAEDIRARAGITRRAGLRRTRGSHVVLPSLTKERALLLTARRDGRVFFVLPWGRFSLVGTTDVDDRTAPESIGPTREDIRYLLEEAARAVPGLNGTPVRAFAGLRSLAQGSAIMPWANSREHRILREGSMLTLLGGKYTTHRSLAERVVDQVVRMTGVKAGRCITKETPIEGRKLGEGVTEMDVASAVRNERARHLEDVLQRRSRLWLDAEAMRNAADPVSRWMAPRLGWSDEVRAREVKRVLEALLREKAIVEAAR